ncbi:MAG: O-antigen ligase family protein [Candidatus Hydrogenedentes bacterium]|nr:O-antigen ligase family protein [Candidatus Hydrogenedentota bacterium]
MALFRRSEYGIGRGEIAESRVEFPFFVAFMFASALGLLIFHWYFQNISFTLAIGISLLIFGLTVLRVELGVFFLVIAMLLSPEIDAGKVGLGNRALNVRYNDGLIIVVFVGVLVKIAFEGRQHFWLPNPVNPGIALYYGVCLLSTMFAYRASIPLFDKQEALFTLLKMAEFYMIFVLVGNAIRSIRQVRQQLVVFFITAAIVALYGLYTRFISGMDRVSAPFEQGGTEPNTLGGYLVMVMCLAAALYTQAPNRQAKILCGLMAFVPFFTFLFTLSRASYIAFIAGLVALGIIARKPTIIVAVAAVLIASPFIMPDDVKDRVNYTFQRGDGKDVSIAGYETGLQVDKSTHERIYVWQKVRYNLYVWPWFGGGVSWDRVLDSMYARVLIETGIVGFVAFVFLQLRLLKTMREAYLWNSNWLARGIAMGMFATTIALITHSMGTISFLIVRMMEPYWFLVALAVLARHLAIEEYVRAKRAEQATALPKAA